MAAHTTHAWKKSQVRHTAFAPATKTTGLMPFVPKLPYTLPNPLRSLFAKLSIEPSHLLATRITVDPGARRYR